MIIAIVLFEISFASVHPLHRDAQYEAKMGQSWAKMALRRPKMAQDDPKIAQDGSRMRPSGPKMSKLPRRWVTASS